MASKKIIGIAAVLIVVGGGVGGYLIWYNTTPVLTLLTTTSMNDSGLLDQVAPAFFQKTGIRLRWVSQGTGAALESAGRGDGDVVIVHSATSEKEFINHSSTTYSYSGHGIMRVNFAYNYFLVVGPTTDPAKVGEGASRTNGTLAFKKIYDAAEAGDTTVLFASRGDASGTHSKENSTWKATGGVGSIPTTKTWYKSLGKGMADTLVQCNELKAYTLTDYGTWLKVRKNCPNLTNVTALNCGDLKNTYSVIALDPTKHPTANIAGAKQFIYFMLLEGQFVIGNYTIDGEMPFTYSAKADCSCGHEQCEVENGEMKKILPNLVGTKAFSGPATICVIS